MIKNGERGKVHNENSCSASSTDTLSFYFPFQSWFEQTYYIFLMKCINSCT